jgi:molybdopterin molybdotransferase
MVSCSEARQRVIQVASALQRSPAQETVDLAVNPETVCGRVLAQSISADRDYPPFNRSTRDGFAVRAADATAGATLECIGEIKAGGGFDRVVGARECVQIMTGAALPAGADAVIMVEYTHMTGKQVSLEQPVEVGKNIVMRGSEARAGQELIPAGTRLGYPELALAAQVGQHRVIVWKRPRVAVLSTGDEVVDITAAPGPLEIRNSNGLALQTLIALSGGEAVPLGNAPDEKTELRRRIEKGLEADVLVLSGGVSMGKYDLVEAVLAELGAEIFFDAVAIRPGRPAVFGRCRGKLVFGLPGNPISTMVTFELFVVPAIDILGGAVPQPLPILGARLKHAVHERGALTHFVPAQLTGAACELERRQTDSSGTHPEVSTLAWHGSGDTVAVARANAFLVVPAEKLDWAEGEWAMVLARRVPGGRIS